MFKPPPHRSQKVVIISPAHPLRGGIAASGERLAQAFAAAGDDVTIYSFSLQYPKILFPGKTQYSDDPAPQDLYIKTVINAISPFNWWRVGRKLRREQADLIVCRFWLPFMSPSLGSILRLTKRRNTRIVGLVDNIVPHEKRFGDRFLARYFVAACDAFLVMSRSVETEIRTFTTDKPIVFIPHPVYDIYGEALTREVALQRLGLDVSKKYLLFFGLIRAYKGLDWLLEAMADEHVRALDLKLLVAGEFYEPEAQYRTQIATLGLTENVYIYPEFVPTEAVRDYFGAADLVVQPYKTATQSGISQVAYHFDKPMLVTNVGGLAEIVPHGEVGYVVAPAPTAIAEALLDFFTHDRAEAMIANVKRAKLRFSWAVMVEALKNI